MIDGLELHYSASSPEEMDWLDSMMEKFKDKYQLVATGVVLVTKGEENDVVLRPESKGTIEALVSESTGETVPVPENNPLKIRKWVVQSASMHGKEISRNTFERNYTIFHSYLLN